MLVVSRLSVSICLCCRGTAAALDGQSCRDGSRCLVHALRGMRLAIAGRPTEEASEEGRVRLHGQDPSAVAWRQACEARLSAVRQGGAGSGRVLRRAVVERAAGVVELSTAS